jgi:hypothetical protein
MATTKFVTTEPLYGFKFVGASYGSLVSTTAPVTYLVGTTVELGDDDVQPCVRGLHFCPKVLDCCHYFNFYPTLTRIVRVVVPVGATVATDDGGRKYAASALTVVADVTADADALLTTMENDSGRILWRFAGRPHRDVDDEPALVSRTAHQTYKRWFVGGTEHPACLRKYAWVWRDAEGYVWASRPGLNLEAITDPTERAALTAILDRRESFETQ